MSRNLLILITGPIGGGKSSTAVAIAGLYRAKGIAAASVDMDDIYLTIRPDFSPEGWGETRRGAGALADQFMADSHDIVIVEGGDFKTEEEFTKLEQRVKRAERKLRITLLASYEEVRRNIIADPNRDVEPPVKPWRNYERFLQVLPYLRNHTVVIETAGLSLADVAQQVYDLAEDLLP
jgi:hypothetical protein